jgi:antitoxin VapB
MGLAEVLHGHGKDSKVVHDNRSQAVRLPKEFQFAAKEVYIRKEGSDVVLSPRPGSMEEYIASRLPVGDDYVKIIETMDDPVPQDREIF